MTLRNLDIDFGYMGKGEEILSSFILPCLSASISYDRITSYYSFASLIALSEGIQSLYERKGKMRLILGVHSIPPEIAEATLQRSFLEKEIEAIRHDIETGIKTISEELRKKSIATLGWMMEDGLLEVKAVSLQGEGIFHPKTLLFKDEEGNRVVAVGSSNETGNGLGSNIEQLMVVCSWDSDGAVSKQEEFFGELWDDARSDAIVGEITDELAVTILNSLGSSYANPKYGRAHPARDVLSTAAKMPANFFVSGMIPALYQHQERAVIEALSRWPVRVLFADEVGLGKTFEAAATLTYLVNYCGVKRVLILTPKSVLKQWQDELHEHFGLTAWLYESSSKSYVDPEGRTLPIGASNPIGKKAPDVMLMSAQYARGSRKHKNIFERSGAILPDLLILDEAHSARAGADISGSSKKTIIYSMLEKYAPLIPHVILATATPMQKEPAEFHSMLKILGIPNVWKKPRSYDASLRLTMAEEIPSLQEAYTAAKLFRSTMKSYSPVLGSLEPNEKSALQELMSLSEESDNDVIASYVMNNWPSLRPAFVKLHPAHLLTVRNTRRSLTDIGYRFPIRNLHAETIVDSSDVQLFYMDVEDYITKQYFSVEKALFPERKMNVGFVRISYQQRLASSLYSCRESLRRRFNKLSDIQAALSANTAVSMKAEDADMFSGFDDYSYDDALFAGDEDFGYSDDTTDGIDREELDRALTLERASLATLLGKVSRLLEKCGDLKIARAVQLALSHLGKHDKVLVFSRYTDTVDALLEVFNGVKGKPSSYGLYTGKKAVVISGGKETPVTKEDVKRGLEKGDTPIVFCSDAASEGLNLQAARVLINVDVPWTPARLEQRIGRIARLGQKADEVEVYNIWYPNSVEAKMYTRINNRLKDMDIAVGEFPQVVADRIRSAIMGGDGDDGLDELQEIRNSVQVKALEKLWSSTTRGVTTSRHIRDGLMELCDAELKLITSDDQKRFYELSGGGTISLSPEEGLPESVSYRSLIDMRIDYDLDDVVILKDESGNPAAFAFKDGAAAFDHEQLIDLLLDRPVYQGHDDRAVPKMLPDNKGLDLSFAVSCDVPARPSFWPPIS